MLNLFRRSGKDVKRPTVGWILDKDKQGFIWEAPRPFNQHLGPAKHAKAVHGAQGS